MTREEQIKVIEEKIKDLKNATFTHDEETIIEENTRLTNLMISTILNNPDLCCVAVTENIPESVLNIIITDHMATFGPVFIENKLKNEVPSTEEFLNDIGIFNFSEEQIEYYLNKIKEIFKDPNTTVDRFELSSSVVNELLDYKRYDIISQIKNYQAIFENNAISERIWNEFPFEQYQVPEGAVTANEATITHLKYCPLSGLIYLYDNYMSYISPFLHSDYDKKKQEFALETIESLIDEINTRLKNGEQMDYATYRNNIYSYDKYLVKENDNISKDLKNKINEFALILYKNGFYELLPYLASKNLIPLEELKEQIKYIVKNVDPSIVSNIKLSNILTEHFMLDEEMAEILVKNGLIKEANQIVSNTIEKNLPYILTQIQENNKKYFACLKEIEITSNADLKIAIEGVKKGLVKRVAFHYYFEFTNESIELIKELVLSSKETEIDMSYLNNEHFKAIVPELETYKKYDIIVNYLLSSYTFNINNLLGPNGIELVRTIIKEDHEQGLKLFNRNPEDILKMPELLEVYYTNQIYMKAILEYVNHHEDLETFYNNQNYDIYREFLSTEYNIPIEKLDKIKNGFGPKILRYIENENIKKIAALSLSDLDKIIALFKKSEFTFQDLEGTYDSLKQYEFGKKNLKDIQIFPSILHAIEDKNEELLKELCTKLANGLDKNYLEKARRKYTIPEEFNENNLIIFVTFIIEKIKTSDSEKLEKYQNILHDMTSFYISKKREEYRQTYDIVEELHLPYDLDERSKENVIVRKLIENSHNINSEHAKPSKSYFNQEYYTLYEYLIICMQEKGVDSELAKETIAYYITKDKTKCHDIKSVEKTINILVKIVKEIYKIYYTEYHNKTYYNNGIAHNILNFINEYGNNKQEIKRIYKVPPYEGDIYKIITSLNINALKKGVLDNQEVYSSLLRTMEKRKLHLLPDNISNILETEYIDIPKDLTNIAGFISYYASIYETVKSTLESNGKNIDNFILNMTNILIYANVYSGISNIYSQILGDEDAKLIKANPGPNAASRKTANDGRLKEAVELTKTIYERQEITIPSFNENISLSNNKSMRIIVGNFTNPSTLTHGERTGACMRIGGVGETLFQFALTNPNGFHIRFEDPYTGAYISRVTGFRNGNTVFLNELRESCSQDKYSNSDVIEACKKAAEMLITLSKNSPCPISNVVVHKAYATQDMNAKLEKLNVSNIKEGLPFFYSDVNQSAIVLATTATDKPFTEVNLDKSKIPTYKVAREKPLTTTDVKLAAQKISRVYSVKKLLAGENYEYIEPYNFKSDLIYAIVNDDWFVYLDENGEITHDIIDIDERAKEELATAIVEVEKYLAEHNTKENKYGIQQ